LEAEGELGCHGRNWRAASDKWRVEEHSQYWLCHGERSFLRCLVNNLGPPPPVFS
jgi:hypothetical protein